MLEAVLSHGDSINVRGPSRLTPLQISTEMQNITMLTKLIELQADVNLVDVTNSTALHKAVHTDNDEILMALLCVDDIIVDVIDDNGKTPLHIACENGQMKTVQLLLTRQADPYLYNNGQIPPLLTAIHQKHDQVAYFITASCQATPQQIINLLSAAGDPDMGSIAALDVNVHAHNEQVNVDMTSNINVVHQHLLGPFGAYCPSPFRRLAIHNISPNTRLVAASGSCPLKMLGYVTDYNH